MYRRIRLFLALVLLVGWSSLALAGDPVFPAEPGTFPVVRINCVDVLPGNNAEVLVGAEFRMPVGGFDWLLMYDAGGLGFQNAAAIGDLIDWEYFTFRNSTEGSIGLLRLVGIADMNDGNTPDPSVYEAQGWLVKLSFGTSADPQHICRCFDLKWVWRDCGDNVISNPSGNSLYFAYNIDHQLPAEDCLGESPGVTPVANVRYMDGCICVLPQGSSAGDLDNNNEVDVADVIYWLEYVFEKGPEPIGDQACDSFCRADYNCDGRLNIADVAAMIRFLLREGEPGPCDPCGDE